MNFPLKDPNCKLTTASNIIVMIRRKWPSGFLRTAKIGVLVFAVCILERSSEQHEQIVRREESKENTAILPIYIE